MVSYSLIQKLITIVDKTNVLSKKLGKNVNVFDISEIIFPEFSCDEAGFLRLISWLYMIYQEAGQASLHFLLDKFDAFSLDQDHTARNHIKSVYCIRTCLQHNIDETKKRNQSMVNTATEWYCNACGCIPQGSELWGKCLNQIITDANACLETFHKCVLEISKDEFSNEIINDWNYRCSRYHPPEEYDRLISIVAADIGQDFISPSTIRKRYYDLWSRELGLLGWNYNFEKEARKRIERVLLESEILPITGEDIITRFNIPPGIEVGNLLRRARQIYEEKPCSGEILIVKIGEYIEKQ